MLVLCFSCSTVLTASFTTKNIGQSNSLTGQSNTITVTIVTDANLAVTDSSAVTITGLSNAVASSHTTLLDKGIMARPYSQMERHKAKGTGALAR